MTCVAFRVLVLLCLLGEIDGELWLSCVLPSISLSEKMSNTAADALLFRCDGPLRRRVWGLCAPGPGLSALSSSRSVKPVFLLGISSLWAFVVLSRAILAVGVSGEVRSDVRSGVALWLKGWVLRRVKRPAKVIRSQQEQAHYSCCCCTP